MAKKTITFTTRQKISLSKTKYTKDYIMQKGAEYIEKIASAPKEDKVIPSVVAFCLHAGISRSRVYELAQQWQEVADIIEYIGMLQEDAALQGGMTNRLNPIFSMFLLKGKHGYIDHAPQLNQTNNFNISPELLSDALQLMREKKAREE